MSLTLGLFALSFVKYLAHARPLSRRQTSSGVVHRSFDTSTAPSSSSLLLKETSPSNSVVQTTSTPVDDLATSPFAISPTSTQQPDKTPFLSASPSRLGAFAAEDSSQTLMDHVPTTSAIASLEDDIVKTTHPLPQPHLASSATFHTMSSASIVSTLPFWTQSSPSLLVPLSHYTTASSASSRMPLPTQPGPSTTKIPSPGSPEYTPEVYDHGGQAGGLDHYMIPFTITPAGHHPSFDHSKTAGLVFGVFIAVSLLVYGILKVWSTRRSKTHDAKAARLWEYLTPSPRTKAAATFQGKGVGNFDVMDSDSEKGFSDLVASPAEDASPSLTLLHTPVPEGAKERFSSIPLVHWLKFNPPPSPRSPPPVYQPLARHPTRIMNITREVPPSRFSVSSSDYEDDGCVGDRRCLEENRTSLESISTRPNSASSWGSAVSGEDLRPHNTKRRSAPVVVVAQGKPMEVERSSILVESSAMGNINSQKHGVSWAPLPTREDTV